MRCSLLLVFAFVLLSSPATAQDATRTISVYGAGYVEGDADRATVTIALEGSGSSLREAVADAQGKVVEITEPLRRVGLPETAFTTSRFTGYGGGRPFLFAKREYKTSIALTVTVDNLDLLEAVVLVLSESPVERIADLSFALRDLDALRRSSREQALSDAETKAAAMAAQLGLALGPVLGVEEQPTIRQNPNANYYVDGVRITEEVFMTRERPVVPEVQIFAQRFAVQAGVRVTYALAGE
ncbi:MAG: SIMPL domain-containing protein [Rhodothermales bacterium]